VWNLVSRREFWARSLDPRNKLRGMRIAVLITSLIAPRRQRWLGAGKGRG
jgi:hypothetical protein